MRRLLTYLLVFTLNLVLKLRYKVTVKGFDRLDQNKGILFLANHPALIDPCLMISKFWIPFKIHPVAADFLLQSGFLRYMLGLVGTVYVPGFDYTSNSFKKLQVEKAYDVMVDLLKKKENLLLYPAGGLKRGPLEVVGGASGTLTILERLPDVNIVLVRSTGLWGSTFSKAISGKTPDIFETLKHGMKVILKNGIFFVPRRQVLIECMPAPAEFPRTGDRRTINQYLENWYNLRGPEPLSLISFSQLGVKLPTVYQKPKEPEVDLDAIDEKIKTRVVQELAQIARISEKQIKPEQDLSVDLGLDSLDRAQLVLVLKEQFGVTGLTSVDLTTVGSLMAYAARLKQAGPPEVEKEAEIPDWFRIEGRPKVCYPEADTLIEAFLMSCDRMGKQMAAADPMAGEVSYQRLKLGVILFALYIKQLPGDKVGIMLPASIAASLLTFATLLAGKTPVMINWTLGKRNLEAVLEQTGLQATLSAWKFLDNLDNTELAGFTEQITTLEEIRSGFSWRDKLKATCLARKSAPALLKYFGAHKLTGEQTAAILFTSGTESIPKGVPLSHRNIMENHRDALRSFHIEETDVLLGFLPPFHSFGFSVSGILPFLAGWRVAFTPNPTQGRQIASAIKRWQATVICTAPTFLRTLLRSANTEQLASLRFVVSGAEKADPGLFKKVKEINGEIEILEGYGVTECAPILTLNILDQPAAGVGLPLSQVELRIVNPETFEHVHMGKPGLILARGPNVFSGYLNGGHSPFVELEGEKWYQTGDLGFLDERGYLTLSGRLKRFVKIGGEMVSLGAVEEALLESAPDQGWKLDPELPTFAVCAIEEDGKKSTLHLFSTIELDKNSINTVLKQKGMSNLIRIHAVHQVPIIPLLGTGKIDYQTLQKKVKDGVS